MKLDKACTIGITLTCCVIWAMIINGLITTLHSTDIIFRGQIIIPYLFYTCLCAPIFEELMFRHIPLQTAKLVYDPNSSKGLKLTMLTIIMSSVIFGLCHGRGWDSVLLQGFLGMGFCYVYLKNNYSYWSAVIIHSLYNFTCLFL